MNNLSILLKNSFNNMIGALTRKKKRGINHPVVFGIIAFFGFWLLSFLQAYSQFVGLAPLGLSKMPLFNGFLITFVLLVLYVAMKVTATPKTSDTDLLLSLPIKTHTIALSKVLARYFFDFLVSFLLLTPYIIFYLIYEGFSFPFLLIGLTFVFSLPLLSVGLNYVLDFVVTRLFNKSKYASLLKSLFAIVIFLSALVLFIFTMPNYGLVDPLEVDAFIYKFPPISWFLKFLLTGDIVSLMLIISITLPPFFLGVWLYSKNFGKNFGIYQNKSKDLIFSNNTSVLKSLITKEIKRYFLTPIYILNTIIGPVFMLGFAVFVALKGSVGISDMIGMPIAPELIFAVAIIAVCGFISLTTISASAISLEGKNLWILKSTPAKESDIFLAKAFPNIILTAPVAFICTLVLSVIFEFTLLQTVLCVAIPVVMSLNISFGGLLINLLLPKLEWSEEIQVVKQGLSVVVSMLLGFILVAVPALLYFVMPSVAVTLLAILTLAIYCFVLVTTILILFSKGKKLFQKL